MRCLIILLACCMLAGCQGEKIVAIDNPEPQEKYNFSTSMIKIVEPHTCPVCGSEERELWYEAQKGYIAERLTIHDWNIWVCADCGNVYVVKQLQGLQ